MYYRDGKSPWGDGLVGTSAGWRGARLAGILAGWRAPRGVRLAGILAGSVILMVMASLASDWSSSQVLKNEPMAATGMLPSPATEATQVEHLEQISLQLAGMMKVHGIVAAAGSLERPHGQARAWLWEAGP